jgi:hypothetical protein
MLGGVFPVFGALLVAHFFFRKLINIVAGGFQLDFIGSI